MTLQQISIFPQRALFENGTLCQCIQSKRTHGQRQCSNNKTLIENIMNMNKYDTFRMRYQTRIECCDVITSNATMDWNHCGSDQYTEMMGFISRTREILDWQSWDGNNMCVLCSAVFWGNGDGNLMYVGMMMSHPSPSLLLFSVDVGRVGCIYDAHIPRPLCRCVLYTPVASLRIACAADGWRW